MIRNVRQGAKTYADRAGFPENGEPDYFYRAADTGRLYYWAEGDYQEVGGGGGGANIDTSGLATKITYPPVDRTAWDFLHTPIGTISAISEGDLINTSFTQADIAQFGGMFSGAARRGHYFEYGSISGQLRLQITYNANTYLDPQTGPTTTYLMKVSHIAFNGTSDDVRVIYDGLRDGSGTINNLTDYPIPKSNTFLNNSDTFFMPDTYWFPDYETVKEFEAWQHLKITTSGTVLDLEDVYQKASSGIATLSVIKAEVGDVVALQAAIDLINEQLNTLSAQVAAIVGAGE